MLQNLIEVSGYQITEVIYESIDTILLRGKRLLDSQSIQIKILRSENPSLEQISRLKQEYLLCHQLEIEGIVKTYALETYNNHHALILEDFGGVSLASLLKSSSLDIQAFLRLAIQITEIIGKLHQNQIVHKNINPHSIIINPQTQQVKITDFSMASRLSKETPTFNNNLWLENSLPYISPEQTGRMNRSVDYRTDFYSLGVTFYQLLTGQLPFYSDNTLELIHYHIAFQPPNLLQINPDIPPSLAKLVIKLLAKNAEDRYQSAAGLSADLEKCLKQWETTKNIPEFEPGQLDLSAQFCIPQKLYGREIEISSLMAAFERVSQGKSEMVLVSGYSGIGKSSLVNEVHKPIVREHGYFISGKFDQYKRNIPYAALIQALGGLIRQLLAESIPNQAIWEQKILQALGTQGKVITELIPELELIIGKQPECPQLLPTESQNRLSLLFKEFIKVFTQKSHPLVIFLDDLQWADLASLKLMQILITDINSQYLLLIAAYRDNEVSPTHPFIQTVEEIQNTGISVNKIILKALDLQDVTQLISETLNETERVKSLAGLLFNKTGGNPFFLNQLLQSLVQEELLKFDYNCAAWQWSIEKIQAIGITDQNVVELIAGKIQKLPVATQEVLKLAACIGNRFSLDVLAIVNHKSIELTAYELWSALESGLVLPLNEAYKISLLFELVEIHNLNFDDLKISYKFLHDRVQQAAYALIPDEQKKSTHHRIGQLLLENTPKEQWEENIFDLVNQLNIAADLLNQQSEKYELAQLNLIAARKAKAASAYEPAFRYLKVALELLAVDSWEQEYQLTLSIYQLAAEAAYLNADYETLQQLVNISLPKAKTGLDKVKFYELKITYYGSQNQPLAAIDTALEVLKILGISLPSNPNQLDILLGILSVKLRLRMKKIEDLANLPAINAPDKIAILRILASIFPSCYLAKPPLVLLIAITMVKLCIKYGNSPGAALAYNIYGAILCTIGDINSGYQFGQLALKILERFQAKQLKVKIYHIFNTFINPWKDHIEKTLPPLKEGFQSGMEIGDLEHSAYCASIYCRHIYESDIDRKIVVKEIEKYLEYIRLLNLDFLINWIGSIQQMAMNLSSENEHPYYLAGPIFNEIETLPKFIESKHLTILAEFYVYKLQVFYLFERYDLAKEAVELCDKYHDKNSVLVALFSIKEFYQALTMLALSKTVNKKEQKQYLNQVAANQKKLKKWAAKAPNNYQHKCDIIEAVRCSILNKNMKAIELFDRAIKGAVAGGYIQEEALAKELAAEFYLSQNQEKIARLYLTDAREAYTRWGAFAKVRQLEKKYPQFFNQISNNNSNNPTLTSDSTNLAALDLATVIKASQTISSEMELNKLLPKLMEILLQNAAATKSSLILVQDDKLILVAEGKVAGEEKVITLPFVYIEETLQVPISVINYVCSTRETVVLNESYQEELFTKDTYIINQKPQSILVLPVIYQGQLTGILYLENSILKYAFTTDHLEVLSLLASQASISLSNANYYKQLSQQLQQKNQDLELINLALQESEAREKEKSQQLTTALDSLQRTQAQLIQSEKMSSLGQMVAGVAHEINNPITFISGNIKYLEEYTEKILALAQLYHKTYADVSPEIIELLEEIDFDFIATDLPKLLKSIKGGTERIKEIVLSLRNFSRLDEAEYKKADINSGINSSLMMLQYRLNSQGNHPAINLIKDYGELPKILCYPGQLNQVFMNILDNAIDAIEEKIQAGNTKFSPQINLRTSVIENSVVIQIADNGMGMSESVRKLVFDPFFTTKPVGQGSGLGLYICYSIITQKHQGQLECTSILGQGTEFTIKIPIQKEEK